MSNRLRKFTEEREQGFTLIELLVVIIIIGILAAIAIPVFLNQRKKGVDASLKSDLKAMATAQETYITDTPTVQGVVVAAGTGLKTLATGHTMTTSPNNDVQVILNTAGGGYCIKAFNAGASTAKDAATAMTYNSATGGLGQACT